MYASFDSTNGEWWIAKFNGTNWVKLPQAGWFGFTITALATDVYGNLFAALVDGSIHKWDGLAWTMILAGISDYPIFSMVCDGAGKLYTTGNALKRTTFGKCLGWRYMVATY